MYVCVYVCMYVWMDGWMDGWMDVCIHASYHATYRADSFNLTKLISTTVYHVHAQFGESIATVLMQELSRRR